MYIYDMEEIFYSIRIKKRLTYCNECFNIGDEVRVCRIRAALKSG